MLHPSRLGTTVVVDDINTTSWLLQNNGSTTSAENITVNSFIQGRISQDLGDTNQSASPGITPNTLVFNTPVVSASSGAYTTASATGRYAQIGKLIFVQIKVTITNVGTGGVPVVSLPFNIANTNGDMIVMSGRENAVSGKMLQAVGAAGSGTISIYDYANTSPAANGASCVISGVYLAE